MLPEVLLLGYQSYMQKGVKRPFGVVSVGASFGAELDSVASILGRHGVFGSALLGIDTNAEVIAAAHGVYRTGCDMCVVPPEAAGGLSAAGFTIRAARRDGRTIVDARPLRRLHNMDFRVQNFTEDDTLPFGADVISCSNTLPHATHANLNGAADMVAALVEGASPGGVISLACEDRFFTPEYGPYAAWHETLVPILRESCGLKPLLANAMGHELVFQKPA